MMEGSLHVLQNIALWAILVMIFVGTILLLELRFGHLRKGAKRKKSLANNRIPIKTGPRILIHRKHHGQPVKKIKAINRAIRISERRRIKAKKETEKDEILRKLSAGEKPQGKTYWARSLYLW